MEVQDSHKGYGNYRHYGDHESSIHRRYDDYDGHDGYIFYEGYGDHDGYTDHESFGESIGIKLGGHHGISLGGGIHIGL